MNSFEELLYIGDTQYALTLDNFLKKTWTLLDECEEINLTVSFPFDISATFAIEAIFWCLKTLYLL